MAHPGFPDDLLLAQREVHRTYTALAAAAPPPNATQLRRRLLRLTSHIAWHPFWSKTSATWADLRRHAHDVEQQESSG